MRFELRRNSDHRLVDNWDTLTEAITTLYMAINIALIESSYLCFDGQSIATGHELNEWFKTHDLRPA